MIEKIKASLMKDKENQMYLGDKKVEIAKLTPEKWSEFFQVVDLLPGLIVQVFLAPKEDFYSTVMAGLDIGVSEIAEITAVLSGIDREYLRKEVGIDEMIEYVVRFVKKNRIRETAKNLKGLLSQTQE